MNFSDSKIISISAHLVGNKQNKSDLYLTRNKLELDNVILDKLKLFFFNKFLNIEERFSFVHGNSLKYNEVYNFVTDIFNTTNDFHELTRKIAIQLFNSSEHPNIKAGELFICHFKDIKIDNKYIEAIGIFKSETKQGVIEINKDSENLKIKFIEGVDTNKIDKCCLILNLDSIAGYQVLSIENKTEESVYWKDKFLEIAQVGNNFLYTNNFLSLTKDFINNQLEEDVEISKPDRLQLLINTVEYFKKSDSFSHDEFTKSVLVDNNIISSFNNYSSIYIKSNEIDIPSNFEISNNALKRNEKSFKSILKLDKNFHIYIHGGKNNIEHGVEKDGRKFYKIYYLNES